jgi:type I restriction enzyme S subunit
MIAELKPYTEYKESGLPWLGQVPVHWQVVPSKSLFGHRKEKARPGDQMLTASQAHGIIARDEFMAIEGRRVMDVFTGTDILKHVEPNDFVMSMRSFQGGLEWSKVRGAISSAYVMLIPTEYVYHPYYAHLLKSMPYIVALRRTSDLVRDGQALRYANFGQVPLPRVPKTEQAAIVRFLNWANGRVERAIRAKRKVIALLNEQKQAIIHRAVTRGLDPSVPLKPSGIPWLGDIPEHWEMRRAKYLFREIDSRSEAGAETHLAMSQKLGLVPSGMVQSTLRSQSYAGGKLCRAGDLVLNRLKAHLGVFAVASQSGVISPDYTVLRHQSLANADYYACILRSPGFRGELWKRAKGIVEGFWRLYTDDFYDICLPVPPVFEQQQILSLVALQTRTQDITISRLEREIELLREYRTRLVADLVTGKLDVREAAARLPDEELFPDPTDAEDTDTDDDLNADEEADA